jgi:group II intron reverse transcriptase/maturase
MSRLYLKRWLQAGVMHADGHQEERSVGTPQGGVVSPLLANLYLHYVFDRWIRRQAPWVQFERYADDIVCHCQTQAQAEIFLRKLAERLSACGLTLHPEKTRLVYCGRYKPKTWTGPVVFDFLGYQFRPRTIRKRDGTIGTSFVPAISPKAVKKIMDEYRRWRFRSHTGLTLKEVARIWNARLRGWLGYYGRFYRSAMHTLLWQFDVHLSRWWSRKYAVRRTAAMAKIYALRARAPGLFAHWA